MFSIFNNLFARNKTSSQSRPLAQKRRVALQVEGLEARSLMSTMPIAEMPNLSGPQQLPAATGYVITGSMDPSLNDLWDEDSYKFHAKAGDTIRITYSESGNDPHYIQGVWMANASRSVTLGTGQNGALTVPVTAEGDYVIVTKNVVSDDRVDQAKKNNYTINVNIEASATLTVGSLNSMSAPDAAKALLKVDVNQRAQLLEKMTYARAADVMQKFDDAAIGKTFDKMTTKSASEVIWKFSTWERMGKALNNMSTGRASAVIWTFSWANLGKTLGYMDAARAKDVLWTFSWANLGKALDNMNPAQASKVLWKLTWAELGTSLSYMNPANAAQVLGNYSLANQTTALNNMTVTAAAKVVAKFDTARRKDVLNPMTPARKQAIMKALGL